MMFATGDIQIVVFGYFCLVVLLALELNKTSLLQIILLIILLVSGNHHILFIVDGMSCIIFEL
jgi:hypothetical protein